ncbi:MAG TPA: VOC family protein [Gemmatimonadaceae bacterium]|nr:VOC family protein [Gemmatimonadaceae bacterium]
MTSPTSSTQGSAGYTPATSVRGRIAWHDCMASDLAGARAFYGAVLGWGEQEFPMGDTPYVMWTVNGAPMGGFMPLPEEAKAHGAPQHWLTYFGTDDVDASTAQVREAGGQVMVPPQDIPTVGRFSVVSDPFGALFALYQPLQPSPEDAALPAMGAASWHELATTDSVAARDFYGRLLGWEAMDEMDMGGGMMYRMFGRAGSMLGGIFDITEQMQGMPPNWVPYFRVPNLGATIEAVQAKGGTLLNGPMEVPGGDVIAQFTDPQGGYFCAHEVKAG